MVPLRNLNEASLPLNPRYLSEPGTHSEQDVLMWEKRESPLLDAKVMTFPAKVLPGLALDSQTWIPPVTFLS